MTGPEQELGAALRCGERFALKLCSCCSPEVGLQGCCGRNAGRAATSAVARGGVMDGFKGVGEVYLYLWYAGKIGPLLRKMT